MKRIAYVLGEFPSISETFILREMHALRERGFEIMPFALRRPEDGTVHRSAASFPSATYYPSDRGGPPAAEGREATGLPAADVRRALAALVYRHRGRPRILLSAVRRFPTAVRFARLARAAGVGHIHAHFALITADVAAVMAHLTGLRFSVSAHARDIYCSSAAELRARLRDAEFVAVCTRRTRELLLGLLGAPWESRVPLVYHGLSPADFPPGEPTEGLVVAVGRLVEKKGFGVLLDACAILRRRGIGFRCVVVGDGPLRRQLEAQVAALGLSDAVTLRGAMAEQDLLPEFSRAAVAVVPCVMARDGDADGLPNVLLEAMALRVPVVSTSVSGIPEALKDGESGILVEPGDPEALAEGIAKLLRDRELRARLGARARATIEADFDVRRNIRPLAELFDACLRRSGHSGTD
jgi:glycosyltransferase involved in cell wall biosynthesis